MANKKIWDVTPITPVLGTYKIPCGVGDGQAHTVTIVGILDYIQDNIVVNYSELSGVPTLAPIATSGNYADLTNKPKIPSATSELNNDSGYVNLREVRENFALKLRIEDIPEIAGPFNAKAGIFYRVKVYQTRPLDFVDCNCQDVGYLEVVFGEVIPSITFPKGVFVSGKIDEPRKMYQLRFLSNTVIINKFEQI